MHPIINKNLPSHGFTLLELSIFMVIMSMLIGGILGGKVLIKSSEVSSTIVFIQSIQSAHMTFEDKYNALPGDMRNATNVWSAGPVGNGNGHYDSANTATNGENFGAWYHLAASGFIKGNYSGVVGGGVAIGTNSPSVPINNTTTAGFHYDDFFGTFQNQNSLVLGDIGFAASILVVDAEVIDRKIDDGKPFRGSIIAHGAGAECTSTALSATPNIAIRQSTRYNVNNITEKCIMDISVGTTIWE